VDFDPGPAFAEDCRTGSRNNVAKYLLKNKKCYFQKKSKAHLNILYS
jgi:hypothetical protein